MKTQARKHYLEPIGIPRSKQKYKCKVCQQEWITLPASACPGVRVFFSRDPKICPAHYKTLLELADKDLRPKDENQPSAALRSSHQGPFVLLYDETKAVPKKRSETIIIVLKRGFATVVWLVNVVSAALITFLLGFNPAPSSLKAIPLIAFVEGNTLLTLIIICGLILTMLIALVIFLRLTLNDFRPLIRWHVHSWGLATVISTVSFLLCFTLLILVLLRPVWCPQSLCLSPKLILNQQGVHDDNLEVYFQTIQSGSYMIPGDPASYTLGDLPKSISTKRYDEGSSNPYRVVVGIHSLQQGRFGIIIEQVALVVKQVTLAPYPLRVWTENELRDFHNNLYQVTYRGQSAGATLVALYLPQPIEHVQLIPGESDELALQVLSQRAVDFHFQVQIVYRVFNESQEHTLTLPNMFEIIFSNAANWYSYHFEGGHLVADF